jgi:hypothetical protein
VYLFIFLSPKIKTRTPLKAKVKKSTLVKANASCTYSFRIFFSLKYYETGTRAHTASCRADTTRRPSTRSRSPLCPSLSLSLCKVDFPRDFMEGITYSARKRQQGTRQHYKRYSSSSRSTQRTDSSRNFVLYFLSLPFL